MSKDKHYVSTTLQKVFDKKTGDFLGYTERVAWGEFNHFDQDRNYLGSSTDGKFDFKRNYLEEDIEEESSVWALFVHWE